ncbi:cytochrome P450 3A11-like [Lineus longissimus]|uniref:cytochrome P450 3A11-like n=1 Tax=Lineus longissimus TaxID=88925 RepID=UPI002B4D85A7
MITEILLLLVVGLLTGIVWNRKKKQQWFKDLGIPGPEPSLFLGNQLELLDGPTQAVKRWTKEYGKTFGYFEGVTPVLVTSDLEIIKHVFITDFKHFMARKPFPFGPDPESKNFSNVFLAHGQMWKRYRSFMSPMLSTTKLKATTPLITKACDTMMDILEEKSKEVKPFDVLPYYQGLTMDVISSTAFGLEIEAQKDPENEFLVNTKALFKHHNFRREPRYRQALVLMAIMFPSVGSFLFKLFAYLFMLGIIKFEAFQLGERLEEVIQERRQCKERGEECPKDFLQYMLDAEVDEVDDLDILTIVHDESETPVEMSKMTSGERRQVKKLTKHETVSNLYVFQNAGFDTTSAALAYASYELALNPEVQRRIQDELDEQLGNKPPDYEDIGKLVYLSMAFNEVLRMHPIGPSLVTRLCMERTTICGLTIPAGMTIMANVEDIHYDPEIWGPTDPDVFEPERFSKEERARRHPLSFQAFGIGPRNCVGMRLAQVEAKMALARILQKFSYEKCEETEVPLRKVEQLTVVPENGVTVRLVPREL